MSNILLTEYSVLNLLCIVEDIINIYKLMF